MDGCLGHLPRYDLRSDRLKAFSNGLLTHDRQFQLNDPPKMVHRSTSMMKWKGNF